MISGLVFEDYQNKQTESARDQVGGKPGEYEVMKAKGRLARRG